MVVLSHSLGWAVVYFAVGVAAAETRVLGAWFSVSEWMDVTCERSVAAERPVLYDFAVA